MRLRWRDREVRGNKDWLCKCYFFFPLSVTVICLIMMLVFGPLWVSERSWLCKGRTWGLGACVADMSKLHLWLGSGVAAAQISRRQFLLIIFIPELSCLVIQMSAVPSYLQIKQAVSSVSLLSFPFFLYPSCFLHLLFILVKHTHLNVTVTISTSKHRTSSLPQWLLVLWHVMVN